MKTLKLLTVIALIAGFASCTSTKRMIVKERYDKAIDICVKRLHKNSTNVKERHNLRKAYILANEKDNDKVMYLKKSGQPDVWDEVFVIYSRLDARQSKVKTLTSSILREIGFKEIDYDQEIISAKKKAAEYYYAHGKQLLGMNDKFKAREAYEEFQKVKDFYASYKDVDDLLNQAYVKGQTHVQFEVTNILKIPLPQAVQQELDKMSLGELDNFWVKYETSKKPKGYYDYKVNLQINYFDVGREKEDKNTYKETKKVEDGWEYAKDENGNVMKDSLGNDIKIKKYKTISCRVTEVYQKKSSSITGAMEIYDNHLNRMLKTVPVKGESIFENHYAEAFGDLDALKKETKEKIKGKRLKFPTTVELLMQSFDILKQVTEQAIKDNSYLIQ